jgi:hypothetical protein
MPRAVATIDIEWEKNDTFANYPKELFLFVVVSLNRRKTLFSIPIQKNFRQIKPKYVLFCFKLFCKNQKMLIN